MKKILISTLVLFAFVLSANAQMREGRKMHRMHQKEMYKDLNLTNAQKKKLKDLHAYAANQRKKIMDDRSLRQDQRKEALRELQMSVKEQRNLILTPGQKVRIDENRMRRKDLPNMREERKARRHHRPLPGKAIRLNEMQKEEIRQLNEVYNTKQKEIVDNTFLSKDAKQEQLRELRRQKKATMDSMLTDEQKRNMKTRFHNDRPDHKRPLERKNKSRYYRH